MIVSTIFLQSKPFVLNGKAAARQSGGVARPSWPLVSEWRMANGEWRMANGEWRVTSGE
jgi:hypothetical protein